MKIFLVVVALLLCSIVAVESSNAKKIQVVEHEDEHLSKRSCPNNCSGHGVCSGNQCQCESSPAGSYNGVDCSIFVAVLSNGAPVRGSVADRQWAYYELTLPGAQDRLGFNVVQTTAGDVDLYIRLGKLPDRMHFDAVDNSGNSNFTLKIDNPSAGKWYAGVYGFDGCQFTITGFYEGAPSCPNNCNNHGTCDENNACICNLPYYGASCQYTMPILSSTPISDTLLLHTWQYYQLQVQQPMEAITIFVNQTSQGDSDMYIKFNSIPSFFDYDYKEVSYDANYNITVGNPNVGLYIVGLYGYTEVAFRIYTKVVVESTCNLTNCSDHGSCLSSGCQCHSGFSGEFCESMTAQIPTDTPIPGFVQDSMWNYYHITPDTAANMIINILQEQEAGYHDCDAYVKAGQLPTRESYDARDIGFDSNFTITIENPQQQTWYIGVYGFRSCHYTIDVSFDNNCPNDCSGHGQCEDGRCVCNSPWVGAACDEGVTSLRDEQPVFNVTIALDEWKYYLVNITSSGYSSLTVSMHELSTTGLIWLYIGQGNPPTVNEYIKSDTNRASSYHTTYISNVTPNQNHMFFVGVYGSPYLPSDVQAPFELVAYWPPF